MSSGAVTFGDENDEGGRDEPPPISSARSTDGSIGIGVGIVGGGCLGGPGDERSGSSGGHDPDRRFAGRTFITGGSAGSAPSPLRARRSLRLRRFALVALVAFVVAAVAVAEETEEVTTASALVEATETRCTCTDEAGRLGELP